MVRQIYQKAESIKPNLNEAWGKLEDLEQAYHDMIMRVTRIQSNKVCLGKLTGEMTTYLTPRFGLLENKHRC